ncbi:MAG: hypothetical protein RLZZ129_653, partial [Verrucomicrobiota bacterium]
AAFIPKQGSAFNVSVWGTFSATVQMQRSFDNGTTWLPLTVGTTELYTWTGGTDVKYSEFAAEPMPGVMYSLECDPFTSGTVNYLIGGPQ